MPSPVLLDRSLNSVAQYLNTDTCNNNVFVLVCDRPIYVYTSVTLSILILVVRRRKVSSP